MILLNPTPGKHGRDMTRVFFFGVTRAARNVDRFWIDAFFALCGAAVY
ncbi:MAG: hypothetical protein CM1200mP34_0710 [Verrucomicrobiales bacterium]|nr:MAG: hypothetical protein CM1200mP34_0710 [Verrucomicrobiales bacterium]